MKIVYRWKVAPGPEDCAIISKRNSLRVLTATAVRGAGGSRGGVLWEINPRDFDEAPKRLERFDEEGRSLPSRDFGPIGLNVVTSDDESTVYLINKLSENEAAVERYLYTDRGLERTGILHVPEKLQRCFSRMNSLAATRDGVVYVSLCHKQFPGESHPMVSLGSPVDAETSIASARFGDDGRIFGTWYSVAKGIRGAHGLLLDKSDEELLVCAHSSAEIFSFRRKPGKLALEAVDGSIPVKGFYPNNLARSPDGTILLAAQRHFVSSVLAGLGIPAPVASSVFQIKEDSATPLFTITGEGAISNALKICNGYILGQVRRSELLCAAEQAL